MPSSLCYLRLNILGWNRVEALCSLGIAFWGQREDDPTVSHPEKPILAQKICFGRRALNWWWGRKPASLHGPISLKLQIDCGRPVLHPILHANSEIQIGTQAVYQEGLSHQQPWQYKGSTMSRGRSGLTTITMKTSADFVTYAVARQNVLQSCSKLWREDQVIYSWLTHSLDMDCTREGQDLE